MSTVYTRRGWRLVGCLGLILGCASLTRGSSIFDDDWQPPAPPVPFAHPHPSASSAPALSAPPTPSTLPAPDQRFSPTPVSGAGTPTTRPTPTAPVKADQQLAVLTDQRREIPGKAERKRSRELMKEIYAVELADRSMAARKALAARLLTDGLAANNVPADEFVLLRGAIDADAEAADLQGAFRAVDALAKDFQVDRLLLKEQMLVKLAARTPPKARGDNLAAGLALFDLLEVSENSDRAERVGEALLQLTAGEAAQRESLQQRIELIQEKRVARELAAEAMAALKANPDDPAANLAAGRSLCLAEGRWPQGLSLLAKGCDEKLKSLAVRDIAATQSAAGSAGTLTGAEALGDDWWAVAEKEHSRFNRQRVQGRAAFWYSQALPRLSGLAKLRVQRRIDSVPTDAVCVDARIVNTADLSEAQAVVADLAKHYRDCLRGITQVEVLKYHDATELHGGGDIPLPKSYAPITKSVGGGGIGLANIYEPWPAGRYIIVYRVQALSEIEGENIAFLDVCHDSGNTIASRRPLAKEFTPGGWVCMPIPLELSHEDTIEYRLWPNDHQIAVDRLYILRVH